MLGRSALIVGDAPTAEKEFRKALEYGQPHGDGRPADGGGDAPERRCRQGRLGVRGRRSSTIRSADAELQARVGEAQLRHRQAQAGAPASFAAALAGDPTNVRAQLGQVRLKAIEGKLDEATADVDKIVVGEPEVARGAAAAGAAEARARRQGRRPRRAQAAPSTRRPSTPGPRLQLISLLISDSQLDAATAEIDAARKARAPELRLKYFEALIAFGKKDLAKARELTQQVLKRAPGPRAGAGAARCDRVPGEALRRRRQPQLQSAVAQAPDHDGARLLLARSYLASGKPARAVEALAPMVGSGEVVDPGDADAGRRDALRQRRPEAGLHVLREGVAVEGASSRWRRRGWRRSRWSSGDLEGGVRKLESLATEEGAPVQTDMALLTGYLRQGNTAQGAGVARGHGEEAAERSDGAPDPRVGAGAAARNCPRRARRSRRRSSSTPTYMPAVAGLAQLDLQEGKTAEARARFEAVLAKDPKNEAGADGPRRSDGAREGAVRGDRRRAAAGDRGQAGCRSAPRLALINLYLRTAMRARRSSAAQEASAALGQDSRILDALGRAQLAAGETNQAIETFNRLAAAEPDVPGAAACGWPRSTRSRKEPEKAIEALLRAQKLAPADAERSRVTWSSLYLMHGQERRGAEAGEGPAGGRAEVGGGFRARR